MIQAVITPAREPASGRPAPAAPVPDLATIKARQQAARAAGAYARIGTTLQIVGERLAEALDLTPGATALDVAAGNGNVTLALARRGADVVSTDYVGALLDLGRIEAAAFPRDLKRAFHDAGPAHFPSALATFFTIGPTSATAARSSSAETFHFFVQ